MIWPVEAINLYRLSFLTHLGQRIANPGSQPNCFHQQEGLNCTQPSSTCQVIKSEVGNGYLPNPVGWFKWETKDNAHMLFASLLCAGLEVKLEVSEVIICMRLLKINQNPDLA